MTVRQLIEALERIDDKERVVEGRTEVTDFENCDSYYNDYKDEVRFKINRVIISEDSTILLEGEV